MFVQRVQFKAPPLSVAVRHNCVEESPLPVAEPAENDPVVDVAPAETSTASPPLALPPSGQPDEELRDEVRSVLAGINEAIFEIETRRQASIVEMQQAAIELAVSIASHLVNERIRSEDFAVEQLVGRMLEELDSERPVTVSLHPDDLRLLDRRIGKSPPPWHDLDRVRLVEDATLLRGDCRAAGEDSGLLSRMDLQLSELRQHLLENLDDAQIERRRTHKGDRELRRFPDRRQPVERSGDPDCAAAGSGR